MDPIQILIDDRFVNKISLIVTDIGYKMGLVIIPVKLKTLDGYRAYEFFVASLNV